MDFRPRVIASVAVMSFLIVAGCGNADDDGNGQQDSQYEIPPEMSDLLTDEEIELLVEEGFELYEGDNPPSIEGTYSANDQEFTYDSSGEATGSPVYTYDWTFANQANAEMDVGYESRGSDDQASGLGGFIAGEEDCFTVAAQVEGVDGEGCSTERTHLVTGCISTAGIDGFQTAYVTENPGGGPNADEQQCPPTDEVYRIADEMDGVAEEISQ